MFYMKKQIEIWSTYPPPYGGVSIHSLRLFNMLREKYSIAFKNFNGDTHIPKKGIKS